MLGSVSGGDDYSWWSFLGSNGVKRRFRVSAPAVAAAIFFVASFGLLPRAFAADNSDNSFAALQAYVQSIDGNSAKAIDAQRDDGVYQALRDFARKAGDASAPSLKGATKLAAGEPQTLLEWMTGKGGSEAPATAAPSAPAHKSARPSAAATYVGSTVCAGCHAPIIAEFNKTLMGKIGMSAKGKGKFECENCHGPGSEHVRLGGGRGVGGIMSFQSDDPRSTDEKNAVCLACHQRGERTYWAGSVHETRGLACTNCHTIMKAVSRKHNLKTTVEAETCFQCHKIKRAQMQYSSHMPIREGKLVCSSCHNPHGSVTDKLIRAASVNQLCYNCHAEKRGPKLWEHAPVRENCLNCHKPHGSDYEYLLVVARPRLCNECHSTVHSPTQGGGFGFPNTPYLLGRACGNCHSNIHGSNKPNGMFFLR